MVGPSEDDPSTWGKGSYTFAKSECAWCHPGGGPLEYDRDGYRYDTSVSGYATAGGLFGTCSQTTTQTCQSNSDCPGGEVCDMPNPNRETDTDGTGTRYGDYWVFDPDNPGADANGLVNQANAWKTGGVAEVDCLWCHYAGYYNYQVRNYCISELGGDKGLAYAASFGLVGTSQSPETPVVKMNNRGDTGSAGGNPDCQIVQYNELNTSYFGYNGILPGSYIVKSPNKEECALCHKADEAWQDKGPADVPLGYTSFQKFIGANTFTDTDTGQLNANEYRIAKGRAEFGKRAESINDPRNPETHMDAGFICVDCHYLLGRVRDISSGNLYQYTPQTFSAILDGQGNTVQPAMSVLGIDHQLAKGNNSPDGKNMDQLDNTVTCKACHIDLTHPNIREIPEGSGEYYLLTRRAGNIRVPIPKHVAFPALHFDVIDCRTCHIYEQNFVKKETVADYSSTPFPLDSPDGYGGIIRNQSVEGPKDPATGEYTDGIHYEPLRIWGCREHDCGPGEMFIQPATTMVNVIWKDRTDGLPYARRFPLEAAKVLREVMSGSATAPFDWTLNSAQNGDKGLIINTTGEIGNMVDILEGVDLGYGTIRPDSQIADPVMDLMLTTFTTSHNRSNIRPLGGQGCVECHSSSDPANDDYSPLSVGFFDKQFKLFEQPVDGGLQMTCDGGDCSAAAAKRIEASHSFPCNFGPPTTIDLTEGLAHGQPLKNTISQADVLCFSDTERGLLMRPQSSVYFDNLDADIKVSYDDTVSYKVNFDAGLSKCPSVLRGEGDTCSYDWIFGDTNVGSGKTVSNTYADASDYTVTLTVTDPLTGYSDSQTTIVIPREVVVHDVTIGISAAGSDGTVTVIIPAALTSNYVYVNWGDGQKTIDRTVFTGTQVYNHTYAASGTYMVYSKVRDSNYLWVEKKQYVTVTVP